MTTGVHIEAAISLELLGSPFGKVDHSLLLCQLGQFDCHLLGQENGNKLCIEYSS